MIEKRRRPTSTRPCYCVFSLSSVIGRLRRLVRIHTTIQQGYSIMIYWLLQKEVYKNCSAVGLRRRFAPQMKSTFFIRNGSFSLGLASKRWNASQKRSAGEVRADFSCPVALEPCNRILAHIQKRRSNAVVLAVHKGNPFLKLFTSH
jgi:hypothetical protein